MTTLSVFFCGTSSTSFDFQHPRFLAGELISTLARHHTGAEFVDWMVVDGPGSGNLQADHQWVEPGEYSDNLGKLTGAGWEENVAHVVALIKGRPEFRRKGKGRITPQDLQAGKIKIFRKQALTQINAIGWSRGGVTCHMLANALADEPELRSLKVNLFTVDPVPGALRFQDHRTHIAGNVQRYVGIYSADERSEGFKTVVPDIAGNTQALWMTMPGRHATLVGNASADGDTASGNFMAPGKVTRWLAEQTLQRWGTPLRSTLAFSERHLLKLYDEMIADKGSYATMRKHHYTFSGGSDRWAGRGGDWLSTRMDAIEGLQPDPKFVNWHHRLLFKNHLPHAYAYAMGKSEDAQALKCLKRTLPATVKSLLASR